MTARSFLISFSSLLLALLFITYRTPMDVVVVSLNLDQLPKQINGYSSRPVSLSQAVVAELNTDGYIYRNYENGKRIINLYVGYYGTRKGGRTGHNPNACYPGSGWAIVEERQVRLPVKLAGSVQSVVMTRMVVQKGENQLLVYHWYQSAGSHILGDGIAMNIHRFKQLIRENRNDGAFVRVSTAVGNSPESADQALEEFITAIVPLLEQYWPVEEDVPR